MANYEVLETVRIPIFDVTATRTTPAPYTFSFSEKPVRAYEINVYEYSGTVADFDFNQVDGTQITLALSAVKNILQLPSDETWKLTMFLGQNYSEWPGDSVTGYGLTLGNEAAYPGIDRFGCFFDTGNLATEFLYTATYAIVKTSAGQYVVIVGKLNEDNVLCPALSSATRLTSLVNYVGEESNPATPEPDPNPYNPGGTTQPGGGGGSFTTPESVDLSGDIPTGSVEANAGNAKLFTRYLMNPSDLAAFGDWLWVDTFGEAIARDFMSLFYGSPMESIISCMSYPFDISSMNVSSQISGVYWGNKVTGLATYILNSSGVRINWGTLAIDGYWNNFLDYAPHTKIELYLPWGTGFVPIDPNEVMNGSITVVTNVELDRGTCIHTVYNQIGSPIGQFSGNCGKQIPVTALDSSGKALSLVTAAVGTVVAGAVGAGTGAAMGKAGIEYVKSNPPRMDLHGAAQYASHRKWEKGYSTAIEQAGAQQTKRAKQFGALASASAVAAFRAPASVQRNGTFNGSGASLGIQYPYVIISRPEQSVPEQYGHHYGYPSNIYTLLGSLYGYAEIGEIHLDGIPATSDELVELDSILKGGVIFG